MCVVCFVLKLLVLLWSWLIRNSFSGSLVILQINILSKIKCKMMRTVLPGGAGYAGRCRWNQSTGGTCQCPCFYSAGLLEVPFPSAPTWRRGTGWSPGFSRTCQRSEKDSSVQTCGLISKNHWKRRARVCAVLQRFHIGERLGVFGNHICQDVLHTCSYFLHSRQTCQG